MIDTTMLYNERATADKILNCWMHADESDVVFCRTCKHVSYCQEIAIKRLMEKMHLNEEITK